MVVVRMWRAVRHDGPVSAGGYESWFVSARDPAAPRALWIRHTTLRPAVGPASAALWCTVVDRGLSRRPVVVKEVGGAFPPGAAAGPGQFRGAAAMAGQAARWDLAITGGPPSLRPLRPAMLYRAPLPRTKLEASVPNGLVTGVLDVDGYQVGVDRWRGPSVTTGEPSMPIAGCGCTPPASAPGRRPGWSWCWPGSGLARRAPPGRRWARSAWVVSSSRWAGSAGGPGSARVPASSPPTFPRREPGLTWPSAPPRTTRSRSPMPIREEESGWSGTLPRAAVELTFRRRGHSDLTLSGTCGAYEYGTSQDLPGIAPRPLPDG